MRVQRYHRSWMLLCGKCTSKPRTRVSTLSTVVLAMVSKSKHNSLRCILQLPCTCYMFWKFKSHHWKFICAKDWSIYFHCFCTIPMFQYFLGLLGKNTLTCVHPKLTNIHLLSKQAYKKENKWKWEKLASHSNFNIWFGKLKLCFTTRWTKKIQNSLFAMSATWSIHYVEQWIFTSSKPWLTVENFPAWNKDWKCTAIMIVQQKKTLLTPG